jgi:hypothetical protein
MPTSAFGCMIFDSMIAVWFLAGAVVSAAPARCNACRPCLNDDYAEALRESNVVT